MKTIMTALTVASSVTGFLALAEAQSKRQGAEAIALQFKKEHMWIGVFAGILVVAT
jgi:hypothetical protein